MGLGNGLASPPGINRVEREVVREIVREVPDRRCIMGHKLSACGAGFRLENGEHISVRVIGDEVRIGCVRLSGADWEKLVARVAAKLYRES